MNPSVLKIAGKPHVLGSRIGGGGEGDVFNIGDTTHEVVKLYKETLRGSREKKVRAMVAHRLAERTRLIAFPSEVATDAAGRFLGFAMRLVKGYRAVHELYSPKSRKLYFSDKDYRFLVRAAQNVARAVATVHLSGCIIGDFNHSGVLVASDATVTLIDADSFQFQVNGQSYPCVVGTEDFTPPELQGKNLSHVERTRAQDHFGLAVAIFQLLGMGKHPYAGRYTGPNPSLGEAIAQHHFAYSVARRHAIPSMPPPGAVELTDFPKPIADAFEAAFGLDPDKRPTPENWVALLQDFETKLHRCSAVPSHYFFSRVQQCTWCRIAERSGVEMFPAGLAAAPIQPDAPFDLARISGAIQSTPIPRFEDVLPHWNGQITHASSWVQQHEASLKRQRIFKIGLTPAFLIAWWAVPNFFLLWCLIGFVAWSILRVSARPEAVLKKAVAEADQRVVNTSKAYLQRIGYLDLYRLRNELHQQVAELQRIEQQLTQNLAQLRTTREARQKNEFLDQFLIRNARIPGIGPGKLTQLLSNNIETAADITPQNVMAVAGFGPGLTDKLMTWRDSHLAKFRYNAAPTAADQQAEHVLRAAAAHKRVALQTKIRTGLATLQQGPARLAQHKASSDPALVAALADRAQAEWDCQALKITPPSRIHFQLSIPQPTPISRAPSPSGPSVARAPAATPAPNASVHAPPRCPNCHSAMQLRLAKNGSHTGQRFWGCTKFPACRGTRKI